MNDKTRLVEQGDRLVASDETVNTRDMLVWVRYDGEFLSVEWDAEHNFTDDQLDAIKEVLIDSCDRHKAQRIAERH